MSAAQTLVTTSGPRWLSLIAEWILSRRWTRVAQKMPQDGVGLIAQNAHITVDEARARILQGIAPLHAISYPLDRALGLVLARDVPAFHDNPPFDNAAMDGFACRAAEIASATQEKPVWLRTTRECLRPAPLHGS